VLCFARKLRRRYEEAFLVKSDGTNVGSEVLAAVVVRLRCTDVSEKNVASIFRVE
jgi:hypothetical protein